MAELQPIIVFHGRHFVRHLGICNPIYVKLLQVMSDVIPRNLKKFNVSISNSFPEVHKRSVHTHPDRHTHTHPDTRDDSIKRNAMRCISLKIKQFTIDMFSTSIVHLAFPQSWGAKENIKCSSVSDNNIKIYNNKTN